MCVPTSHGTLARARPCERVRSMWPALGEGESSKGVTLGWDPVARQRRAIRSIGEWVCDLKSGPNGDRPTCGPVWGGLCNGQSNGLNP